MVCVRFFASALVVGSGLLAGLMVLNVFRKGWKNSVIAISRTRLVVTCSLGLLCRWVSVSSLLLFG